MIEKDFLSLYNESIYFDFSLCFFNALSYFMTCLLFIYLTLLCSGVLNDKSIIQNKFFITHNKLSVCFTKNFLCFNFLLASILTVINYCFSIYINLSSWMIWSVFIMCCSFKFFNRNSAKWIFFSTILFIISLIVIYCLFWYMMNEQINHIFIKFNLQHYQVHYKNFWSIYKPGELHFNYFTFKDKYQHIIDIDNTIPYKRDLMYYYVLYSIALSFWFFVLRRVLHYHKLFINIKI